MAVFIFLWPYFLTTKLRCLQKNNIGHTNAGISFYRGAIQNSEGWKLLNNPRYSPVVDNAYELYNVRDDQGEEVDYKTVYPELYEEMKTIFEVILYLLYI